MALLILRKQFWNMSMTLDLSPVWISVYIGIILIFLTLIGYLLTWILNKSNVKREFKTESQKVQIFLKSFLNELSIFNELLKSILKYHLNIEEILADINKSKKTDDDYIQVLSEAFTNYLERFEDQYKPSYYSELGIEINNLELPPQYLDAIRKIDRDKRQLVKKYSDAFSKPKNPSHITHKRVDIFSIESLTKNNIKTFDLWIPHFEQYLADYSMYNKLRLFGKSHRLPKTPMPKYN